MQLDPVQIDVLKNCQFHSFVRRNIQVNNNNNCHACCLAICYMASVEKIANMRKRISIMKFLKNV